MPSPWDLQVAGEPVETLADLIAWLGVEAAEPDNQRAAIRGFLSMNRREIPEGLLAEAEAFVGD